MVYDTYEEVSQLGTRDPEFAAYLKEHGLENITDISQLPGLEAGPGGTTADPGETLDVPMRDGYKNQLRIHKPKTNVEKSPLVVLIFGGGFMMGDNTQMSPIARPLTKLHGATVVNLSYRLAPANPWPTAPNDVWDNLEWIASNYEALGVDPSAGFILGGGSAGANLAAVTAQKWVGQKREPKLTGLHLAIPVLFTEEIVPAKYKDLWFSREQNKDAFILNTAAVYGLQQAYAPDVSSPDWSPVNARNHSTGLPPVWTSVCGQDPLRDDGLVYERILRDHGVKTKLNVTPGVPHGHVMFPGLKSGSKSNIEAVKGFGWLLGEDKTTEEILEVMPGGDLSSA
ncbi:Alpha/beta hydrolase fold-3 [Neofusicoccum parvum]|uniref:Alpha/beta hydrolase fold-3 n=1 Tax=Neofusicoccum parvum TaxID=310453 RepID=A0ACB5SAL9_9PEZI|nr:Alpha/beta hydrolase fold-3 [Neofusicoccum parvum]GME62917.1 Alpha/beta hydrolase fold-3 [Neofusicoccum parvum]